MRIRHLDVKFLFEKMQFSLEIQLLLFFGKMEHLDFL